MTVQVPNIAGATIDDFRNSPAPFHLLLQEICRHPCRGCGNGSPLSDHLDGATI